MSSKWDSLPDSFTPRRSMAAAPPPQPQRQYYQNHWRAASNSSNSSVNPAAAYYVQSPTQHQLEEQSPSFGGRGDRAKPMSSSSVLLSSTSAESSPIPSPLASPYRATRTSNPISSSYSKMPPPAIHEDPQDLDLDQQRFLRSTAEEQRRSRTIWKIVLFLFGLLCFLVLLFLVMWLILRPSHPHVSVKGVDFQILNILTGTDSSGVLTTMITLNCTTKIDIHNKSPYLQVHVQPFEIGIYLSQVLITSNQVVDYVQAKNSEKVVSMNIYAENVPLYGASNELSATNDALSKGYNVPLNLVTSIRAHYLVVGQMITSNYWTRVTCEITTNTKTLSLLTPVANSCL